MDQDYYHFRVYSIPMQDSHSLYTSMIETSSENMRGDYIYYQICVYINTCFQFFVSFG